MNVARRRAFTLVELMVVVALIAGLGMAIIGGAGGGRRTVALQAAQATLANAVTAARTKAIASGRNVRLLVHDSAESPLAHARFRRMVVVAEDGAGGWRAADVFVLPDGVYVLPHRTRARSGMFVVEAEWRTTDGEQTLGSSALSHAEMTFSHASDEVERWEWLAFTGRGTVDGAGALVVAAGRWRGTASGATDSPIEFLEAGHVRGVMLSNYGVPRLLNERAAF